MEDRDREEMLRGWDVAASKTGVDLNWTECRRALELLPDGGTWAVSPDARGLFALMSDGVLYVVSVTAGGFSVTRRLLQAERIVVSLERKIIAQTHDGVSWTTEWTFRYMDSREDLEAWQRLAGLIELRLGGERLDERERLARELARQAGWTVPSLI